MGEENQFYLNFRPRCSIYLIVRVRALPLLSQRKESWGWRGEERSWWRSAAWTRSRLTSTTQEQSILRGSHPRHPQTTPGTWTRTPVIRGGWDTSLIRMLTRSDSLVLIYFTGWLTLTETLSHSHHTRTEKIANRINIDCLKCLLPQIMFHNKNLDTTVTIPKRFCSSIILGPVTTKFMRTCSLKRDEDCVSI